MNMRVLIFFLSLHIVPFAFASEQELSLMLAENIKKMTGFYTNRDNSAILDISDKFNHILHLPIVANDDGVTISLAMDSITPSDYKELEERYIKKYKHIKKSIVWTFAELPVDLQKNVIERMMDGNEIASQVFIQTPFIYAFKCFSKGNQFCELLGCNDFADFFLTSHLPSPKKKNVKEKIETISMGQQDSNRPRNAFRGSLAGALCCAMTGMPIMGIVISHAHIPMWTLYMPLCIGSVLGCCGGATTNNEKFLDFEKR